MALPQPDPDRFIVHTHDPQNRWFLPQLHRTGFPPGRAAASEAHYNMTLLYINEFREIFGWAPPQFLKDDALCRAYTPVGAPVDPHLFDNKRKVIWIYHDGVKDLEMLRCLSRRRDFNPYAPTEHSMYARTFDTVWAARDTKEEGVPMSVHGQTDWFGGHGFTVNAATFQGQHNAVVDAYATLMNALHIAHDTCWGVAEDGKPGWHLNAPKHNLQGPLRVGWRFNLVGCDTEYYPNPRNITRHLPKEVGLCFLDLFQVKDIDPGPHFVHWVPFIKCYHLFVRQIRTVDGWQAYSPDVRAPAFLNVDTRNCGSCEEMGQQIRQLLDEHLGPLVEADESPPRPGDPETLPDTVFTDAQAESNMPVPPPVPDQVQQDPDTFPDGYMNVLLSTCRHNMRSHGCRRFQECLDANKFHICPNFYYNEPCGLGSIHNGMMHTSRRCVGFKAKDKCGRVGCWQEIRFVHVLQTCNQVRSRNVCWDENCQFGHDNPTVRACVEAEGKEKGAENRIEHRGR